MLDKVQRLVASSLMTALLLLLLADICNQQQIILLCLLMCGSVQQKLFSILRHENRVQFIHGIPVIVMWMTSSSHIFISSVNNFQFNETNTGGSDWSLLVAVLPVSFFGSLLVTRRYDSNRHGVLKNDDVEMLFGKWIFLVFVSVE